MFGKQPEFADGAPLGLAEFFTEISSENNTRGLCDFSSSERFIHLLYTRIGDAIWHIPFPILDKIARKQALNTIEKSKLLIWSRVRGILLSDDAALFRKHHQRNESKEYNLEWGISCIVRAVNGENLSSKEAFFLRNTGIISEKDTGKTMAQSIQKEFSNITERVFSLGRRTPSAGQKQFLHGNRE